MRNTKYSDEDKIAINASIERAIADSEAGRVYSNDQIMTSIRKGFEEIFEAKKSGKKSQSLSDFLRGIEK
ncbi:hypothetical protein [uncultured Mucilaginibacter sp.]|uniref:hypothetical protein n=1 Tax=uncultured Mucilaginibacter sp. TaxID=797541 RepID=UPI0025CD75D0|nr:hypothetical protein [uncultured Mucilaginibacter sp.]